MSDQRHYAPIIIRTGMVSEKERKFLASIIAKERRGEPLTDKQAGWLNSIVRRFQGATMRDDDAVVE